ncbi:MAG TPA: mechanosensitive ion channel family protein [Candidatus Ornithospirochaeta stercorigallinarum]|nr:mechanosensitive ion channel family protein [Candidatus Ornithospirochaeta stercorigallinarum]
MEQSLITQLGADEFVSDITKYFNPERFIPRVIAFIVILAIAIALTRLVRKSFKKLQSMHKISSIFGTLMRKVLNAIIWIVAAVFILQDFGVDLTPVIAGLGISGVVLGFALQETIASFFSGFIIAVKRPFEIGDYVSIGGTEGTVKTMDIMGVSLATGDNKLITMSNKNVWGSVIINTSALDKRRIDMIVPVAYDTDLVKAKDVISSVILSYPEVLKDPEAKIEVHTLADSSINFIVRPWVANADYWTVYWRFQKEIVDAFRANGIEIPYNKLDVTLLKD